MLKLLEWLALPESNILLQEKKNILNCFHLFRSVQQKYKKFQIFFLNF